MAAAGPPAIHAGPAAPISMTSARAVDAVARSDDATMVRTAMDNPGNLDELRLTAPSFRPLLATEDDNRVTD